MLFCDLIEDRVVKSGTEAHLDAISHATEEICAPECDVEVGYLWRITNKILRLELYLDLEVLLIRFDDTPIDWLVVSVAAYEHNLDRVLDIDCLITINTAIVVTKQVLLQSATTLSLLFFFTKMLPDHDLCRWN